ncbi:hypothetical protein [Novosphingobium sp. THN1]|uniref:hypothetical protein n=1 Tax=Novosphingobium sp. THN1 TaxID=1016987 RepID=UPI00351381AC
MPQTPRVGIEGPFFLSISGNRTRATKQVTAANTLAVKRRYDLLVRASREAMKQDRFAPQCHAQRGSAVVVCGAAAHAFAPTPCTLKAFDYHAGAAFELMNFV